DLGESFEGLIDALRWPDSGLGAEPLREMRRLKARMESERLPRGADPTLHTKLGRGGLSDVEWVVQLLQMQHGDTESGLRTTSTLDALDAAEQAGLVEAEDAAILREAWLLATRVRNAHVLALGRASDLVPAQGRDLAAVAFLCGFDPPAELLEEYWRATRRARTVVERLFYG
ncbi:MAG: bifunctional [glutamine synthetase] adenylyltransferase/[glutamine synthetase]-adenylyl-L-tyrosine phosphorylase, partial [Candidatus Nanopelagicales bacterium]